LELTSREINFEQFDALMSDTIEQALWCGGRGLMWNLGFLAVEEKCKRVQTQKNNKQFVCIMLAS
jgi:hypothetical protein